MSRRALVAGVTVACTALAAIFVARCVAAVLAYQIYDVGGRLYLFVATPALAALAASVALLVLRRPTSMAKRHILVLAGVSLAAFPVHWGAIRAGMVGGGYTLPVGFDVSRMSMSELEGAVWDRNPEVAGFAFYELVRRGPAGVDSLWRIVQSKRKRNPRMYVLDSYTQMAVSEFAEQRDMRAVPVLCDMLGAGAPPGSSDGGDAQHEMKDRLLDVRARALNMLKYKYEFEEMEIRSRCAVEWAPGAPGQQ